ncbi:hypothetical protein QYE76_050200 [Lolium multiflorum]|uniref:Uncharacterized protein n=1 Tax=Lolium multiflorum TaxID=4521 RepID=A0AAD8SPI3_LOLMU|nr:hypothetical protein QYE76_050200 [Lolium multiflorum]
MAGRRCPSAGPTCACANGSLWPSVWELCRRLGLCRRPDGLCQEDVVPAVGCGRWPSAQADNLLGCAIGT